MGVVSKIPADPLRYFASISEPVEAPRWLFLNMNWLQDGAFRPYQKYNVEAGKRKYLKISLVHSHFRLCPNRLWQSQYCTTLADYTDLITAVTKPEVEKECKRDGEANQTANPTFSTMPDLDLGLEMALRIWFGIRNWKIAATKPETEITFERKEMGMWFQRISPYFRRCQTFVWHCRHDPPSDVGPYVFLGCRFRNRKHLWWNYLPWLNCLPPSSTYTLIAI